MLSTGTTGISGSFFSTFPLGEAHLVLFCFVSRLKGGFNGVRECFICSPECSAGQAEQEGREG